MTLQAKDILSQMTLLHRLNTFNLKAIDKDKNMQTEKKSLKKYNICIKAVGTRL